jgi:hypothetical protein
MRVQSHAKEKKGSLEPVCRSDISPLIICARHKGQAEARGSSVGKASAPGCQLYATGSASDGKALMLKVPSPT